MVESLMNLSTEWLAKEVTVAVLGLPALTVIVGLESVSEMVEVLSRGQLGEQDDGQDVGEKQSGLHLTQNNIIEGPTRRPT